MFRASFLPPCITLAYAAIGCGGGDLTLPGDPGPATSIVVVAGNQQEALAGTPLPDSLVVKVTDAEGDPIPRQEVAFTLEDQLPGAEVAPMAASTESHGMAAARWVLGRTGGAQQVIARVIPQPESGSLEVRFTASALLPPAQTNLLALLRQPSGSGVVGLKLGRQPVVQIQNSVGADVSASGVPVTAAVASGAGTLVGTTTRVTDGSGRAEFTDLKITGGSGDHVLIFAASGYASVASGVVGIQRASQSGGGTGGTGGGNGGGGGGGGAGGNGGGGDGGGGGAGGGGGEDGGPGGGGHGHGHGGGDGHNGEHGGEDND